MTHRMRWLLSFLICLHGVSVTAAELSFRTQEISKDLTVGYAVRVLDMNEDARPDVLVVDSKRIIWFENPTWRLHTIYRPDPSAR